MNKLVRLRKDVIGGALRAETKMLIFTGDETLPDPTSSLYTWGTVAREYATKIDPIQTTSLGTGDAITGSDNQVLAYEYSDAGYKTVLKCFTSPADPSLYLKIPNTHTHFRIICVSCNGNSDINNSELCRGTFNS